MSVFSLFRSRLTSEIMLVFGIVVVGVRIRGWLVVILCWKIMVKLSIEFWSCYDRSNLGLSHGVIIFSPMVIFSASMCVESQNSF